MRIAPLPDNEKDRLDALIRLDILDTLPEPQFDELTELASSICGTPIALISLIDTHRQWFKSARGLPDVHETPRDFAFCGHAILGQELFVVEDTLLDERFCDHPLVLNDPNIRFYAGMPLVTDDGFSLGTLCAIDQQPKQLTDTQRRALHILARQVMAQMALRRSLKTIQQDARELHALQAKKNHFFSFIAKELQHPFNDLLQFSNQLRLDLDQIDPTELRALVSRLNHAARTTFRMVDNLLQWSMLETHSMPFQPMDIPLDQLIKPIVSMFSPIARQKSVNIQLLVDEGLSVHADIDMMYALLQNVLSNAVRHTRMGGDITVAAHLVEASDSAPVIHIDIQDTGCGMTEQQLQHLFELHPQDPLSAPTQGHNKGAGLGLLLCQRYVALNRGTLSVSSHTEAPSGTSIHLQLPAAQQPLPHIKTADPLSDLPHPASYD
jgi:signal transduction histidine kinase